MKWFATAEIRQPVGDRDSNMLIADGALIVHVNEEAGTTSVTVAVDADTLPQATRRALNALAFPLEVAANPYRLIVESADAPPTYPIVSTRGVANILGVSDARVRQISNRPDFPRPVSVIGLASEVYRVADVEAFKATWNRTTTPGRPRAEVVEALNDGLQLVSQYGDLRDGDQWQVEQALASQGGRFLNGKALTLRRAAARAVTMRARLTDEQAARLDEALAYAQELLKD